MLTQEGSADLLVVHDWRCVLCVRLDADLSKLLRNVPFLTHERMSPLLLGLRFPRLGVRDAGRPERSAGRPESRTPSRAARASTTNNEGDILS